MKYEAVLVSIVIPVYNRSDMVMEAIECSLAQDYKNVEIIVGDNCSTDGTYEKLKKRYENNKNIILFQNESNLGPVGNWERCLEKASGKYVKILWSDDLMSTDFISKTVDLLESNPTVSFVVSSVYMFSVIDELKKAGNGSNNVHYRIKNKSGKYSGKDFVKVSFRCPNKTPVSPGCAIFRRDKLYIIGNIPNNVGYYHRKNGAGPDLLMYLEALVHNEDYIYIDEPLNYFRGHVDSISNFDKTIMEGYLSARLYYLKKYNLSEYYEDLNCSIISCTNHTQIFNRDKNIEALKKYYSVEDGITAVPSIFRVALFKIRNKFCL